MTSYKVSIVSEKREKTSAEQFQTTPKFSKKRGNRSKSSVEPEEYLSWRKPAGDQSTTPTSTNISPAISLPLSNKKQNDNRRNSTGNNNASKHESKNKKKKSKSESSILHSAESSNVTSSFATSTPLRTYKIPSKTTLNLINSKERNAM